MRALVTGATGFVGSNLCRELIDHGYEVAALHRKTSNLESLADLDVVTFVGDLNDRASLDKVCDGVDIVFHIGALFREAGHPDSTYHLVNVEGTKNIIEAAIGKGVSRIVHCSTVGVHGHIPCPPASEEEDYRPGDVYQRTKREGEQVALDYFCDGRIHGTVIRPAMIWGPGDTRTLKLFKGIAHRRMPIIGDGKTLLHWVLVNDLVRAFRLAGEADIASGEVFIVAGERAIGIRELFRLIADCFDTKVFPVRIPALPIQLLGSAVEACCVPFGVEPPIYRRRVDFFTKSRSFDWTKAKTMLGYSPQFTIEEEVKYIAESYRKLRWI